MMRFLLLIVALGAASLWGQEANLDARLGQAALERRQTHAGVSVLTLGEGEHRVYVFLPEGPAAAGAMPMVMFHHGWQGMNPLNYGALLDHLARSGQVVIYPVYQSSDSTSPQVVVANAAEAETRALAALNARGITPAAGRVLFWGYSMGAAISLALAERAAERNLPPADALLLAAPGDAYHVARGPDARSIWGPVEDLPRTLPVAILTGADDTSIGLPSGRKLMARLCGLKPDRRVLLVLPSEEHGGVKVHAAHASPGAPDSRYDFALATPAADIPTHIAGRTGFEKSASLNQLDFFGYWKGTDALLDGLRIAAESGSPFVPPPDLFGTGTTAQKYLGTWPDGVAYKAAVVEQPCLSAH